MNQNFFTVFIFSRFKQQWQINSKEGREGIEKFVKLVTPGNSRVKSSLMNP